ncbi:hypothetical protein A4A49_12001 [Nicotiana attenuata]|uniref:Uncharacterized protein n=1 Tax=Nicotiana attenuata TaxID=49451 RepID=A0A1J6IPV3_NICAT|nr:hypothetical protein A4A49_12001 [Nicotiana attenuata]
MEGSATGAKVVSEVVTVVGNRLLGNVAIGATTVATTGSTIHDGLDSGRTSSRILAELTQPKLRARSKMQKVAWSVLEKQQPNNRRVNMAACSSKGGCPSDYALYSTFNFATLPYLIHKIPRPKDGSFWVVAIQVFAKLQSLIVHCDLPQFSEVQKEALVEVLLSMGRIYTVFLASRME